MIKTKIENSVQKKKQINKIETMTDPFLTKSTFSFHHSCYVCNQDQAKEQKT